jgi:hypothetical protein
MSVVRGVSESQWDSFDARHNEPRIGRVLIASGREAAADVAITTTFAMNTLHSFNVRTDQIAANTLLGSGQFLNAPQCHH